MVANVNITPSRTARVLLNTGTGLTMASTLRVHPTQAKAFSHFSAVAKSLVIPAA